MEERLSSSDFLLKSPIILYILVPKEDGGIAYLSNMFEVSALYVYPVKSLGGIAVDAFRMTDRGPEHDRRFMLVDADGRFLTQREHPQMALFRTSLLDDKLRISHNSDPSASVSVPLNPDNGEELTVEVWGDRCAAIGVSEAADVWFSHTLQRECRLVYMPERSIRRVDPDYAPGGETTAFTDGYPVLAIGEASLSDLNGRLPAPVGMDRFRPNIVFRGGAPFAEDGFKRIRIGDIAFHCVKPCARCVVTTIDQATGEKGREPLATLSTYRNRGNKVDFGMNLLHRGTGFVRIGDRITLESID